MKRSPEDAEPPEFRAVTLPGEFGEALAIRIQVFVAEQGGPAEDEPDEWDAGARHYLVLHDGHAIGTARLYEVEPGVAKIGRVALLPEHRGQGWGRRLLAFMLEQARLLAFREVLVHAQSYACPFYERFGFCSEGEEFMEGGIPHRKMRVRLEPQ